MEPGEAKPQSKADKPKPDIWAALVNNVLKNPFIWGMALTYFFIYVVRQVGMTVAGACPSGRRVLAAGAGMAAGAGGFGGAGGRAVRTVPGHAGGSRAVRGRFRECRAVILVAAGHWDVEACIPEASAPRLS